MSTVLALGDDGAWANWALGALSRSGPDEAGLRGFEWPGTFESGSRIVLLDESRHPTGSLKHETMRLVFRRLVADRTLHFGRPVVVASAGNAAIASAHWCRVLDLPCTVVVPSSTPTAKSEAIRAKHADVVPHNRPAAIYDEAQRIAEHTGGFYLDHFTHAPAAAMQPCWPLARHLSETASVLTGAPPTVIIAGLGSGATAAGLHAYRQAQDLEYRIIGVDAENSAYLPGWLYNVAGYGTGMPTRVEGIGRPVLPDSFNPASVDLIVQAPDPASIAGARRLRALLDEPVGASSGANLWAAIREARRAPRPETIATFVADAHAHYIATCHCDEWCRAKMIDPEAFTDYFAFQDLG